MIVSCNKTTLELRCWETRSAETLALGSCFHRIFRSPKLPLTVSTVHKTIGLWLDNNKRILNSKLKRQMRYPYRHSNVRRLLPASDYCGALFRCLRGVQRFDYRALGGSRKPRGATEHLSAGSENAFVV